MSDNYKPGGGNKPQPYIPAGNGERSGEYTDKPVSKKPKQSVRHCFIKNVLKKYNFKGSKLVGTVNHYYHYNQGQSVPSKFKPNSVIKKIVGGYVVSERYYNNNGEEYLDIHYTCHGNPKTHPVVPHIHRWSKDENGVLKPGKWEDFQ